MEKEIPKAPNHKIANFLKRTVMTLLLAPLMLFVIWVGGSLFKGVIFLIAALMLVEWLQMMNNRKVSAFSVSKTFLTLAGCIYIIFAGFCLIYLRSSGETGRELALWLFAVVWAVDIGAYLFGNIFGGPKLVPKISPSKTWSGLIGGVALATVISSLIVLSLPAFPWWYILLGSATATIAQGGDLLESAIKRYAKVKDSSQLISGHGGVLDRMDGLILAAIFLYIVRFCATI